MKANEFVKENGIDAAKKAIESCCWIEKSYCTKLRHGCIKNDHECCIDVTDLKQLVESHELVEKLGGLALAKFYVPDHYKSDRLKQALADVESCQ